MKVKKEIKKLRERIEALETLVDTRPDPDAQHSVRVVEPTPVQRRAVKDQPQA